MSDWIEHEPQAHMMSAPVTFGVDYGPDDESCVFLVTNSDLDAKDAEIARLREGIRDRDFEVKLLAGHIRNHLAEIERLRVQVAGMTGQADGYRAVIRELSEQLRKEIDANNAGRVQRGNATANVKTTTQAAPIPGPQAVLDSRALVATAPTLDPRLGIAQPEGEPCEPRPTGARWRVMV
jgi:hypothetical protein